MHPVAYNQYWDEHWINAAYNLVTGLSASSSSDDVITLVDGGVGADAASRTALEFLDEEEIDGVWYYTCGDPITNADLDPTNTSDYYVDGVEGVEWLLEELLRSLRESAR